MIDHGLEKVTEEEVFDIVWNEIIPSLCSGPHPEEAVDYDYNCKEDKQKC